MIKVQGNKYSQVFRYRAFRLFWLSFTLSAFGDVMTQVALTWFVYDLTKSPEALGLFALTYTGPVIVGGLIAGPLLDHFDRRKVMLVDSVVRGIAVLLIPILYAVGLLALWHVYLVSAVYGSLMMISLAGSPALVPDLVDKQTLDTANALETLSYTLSGVLGPPIAGFLIPLVSAPNVVLLDAISYFCFAAVLFNLKSITNPAADISADKQRYHLTDAIRLLLKNTVLLSTTLMYMGFNLGFGALLIWLPILSDQVLHGGVELYGFLLGAMALGEMTSSILVGTLQTRLTLGTLICIAQALSGLAVALMLPSLTIPTAVISLGLLGCFSAPLTIWAQTLRMQVIPERLRGRTFALLRTLMRGTFPVGGAAAGVLLPVLTMPGTILISALLIGAPGLVGYQIKGLREADR